MSEGFSGPPAAPPPGHGPQGYGPTGYGPPGYGPPGYVPPGYGPPGYGPPGSIPPGYRPPKSGGGGIVIVVVLAIGAIFVLAIFGSLGIYGVRRYLQKAKTMEARNTVSAIARAAKSAYERDALDTTGGSNGAKHRLCGAAIPVPASVPVGRKYVPSPSDFESGDTVNGWKCLRFAVGMPMYYQYEYRVGGNYKGPARGGRDPGPDGFEVSAEGDLDGDGIKSLFVQTGRIDRATNTVTLDPDVFIVDEFE